MKKIRYALPAILSTFPLVAFASTTTLSDLIKSAIGYLNQALALLMGLAVLLFVWYVIRYFIMPNDKRKEAASYIMWSIIGFFVILSMWGIVNVVIATFNLGNNSPGTWTNLSNLFPQ